MAGTVDVADVIDSHKVSRYQCLIAFMRASASLQFSGMLGVITLGFLADRFGTQITLAALAATLYPTDIRSTGVSWAHGIARIGSIVSVMFAGTMLALHWPLQTMYFLVSIPMFFGSVWILILANERAKTLRNAAGLKSRRAMA